jgi:hypothetical protein
MSARVLFVIGGVFLGAFLVVLGLRFSLNATGGVSTGAPTATPTGYAIVIPPISSVLSGDLLTGAAPTEDTSEPPPSPTPRTLIQADWPPKMPEGGSDTVSIFLIQTLEEVYVAQAERDGQTAVPATLVPRGTPNVSYRDTYGPDYKLVAASATLSATNFTIVPVSEQRVIPYPLEEARVGWAWNVSPQRQGKQALTAQVRFRWESQSGGPPKEQTVWQYTLDVQVGPPDSLGAITIDDGPGAQSQSTSSDPGREQVGFWADALSLVTGLGALGAFAGGAIRWGRERSRALLRG